MDRLPTNAASHKLSIATHVLPRVARDTGADAIMLVGSVARGYADADSDIDLLIIGARRHPGDGVVQYMDAEGESIKLEFHSLAAIGGLRKCSGANAVRNLNRLRDGRVMYDPDGCLGGCLPSIEDVRRAFGPVGVALLAIEELLAAARGAFEEGNMERVGVLTCMAAEALAVVLLSIGDVPVTYTKPKWTGLAIAAIGDRELQQLYVKATLADYAEAEAPRVLRTLRKLAQFVHQHTPPEAREASRSVRRHLWLMDKHVRDTESAYAGPLAWAIRSPSLMATSFGLAALSLALGWSYGSLADALTVARGAGKRLAFLVTGVILPVCPLDADRAASIYNCGVGFHGRVRDFVEPQEPLTQQTLVR